MATAERAVGSAAPGIALEARDGLYLPGCGLWLDPREGRERAFVSHAHTDHIGTHRWTLCTPATARLMSSRIQAGQEVLEVAYHEEVALGGGWRAVLLPAGHVLGSAMLHVTSPEGATLLYTGDFKLRAGLTCERCELRKADVLVMETTYGLPRFVFPDAAEVASGLVAFCRAALEDGDTPVVCAYSLGKAQEVTAILGAAGLPLMAHGAVVKMAKLCKELRGGEGVVPAHYTATAVSGHVLVVPPSAVNSPMVRKLAKPRIAAVTGWAMEPGAVFRFGAEVSFALSDHAGYDDLLATVEAVSPARVYTVHGFTREFAADLRRRGYDARAIGAHEQLDLDFVGGDDVSAAACPVGEVPTSARTGGAGADTSDVAADSFLRFAQVCHGIAGTPSRLEKTKLLAEYFRELDPRSLGVAARFASGLTGAGPLQVGWAILRKALIVASGVTEAEVRAVSAMRRDAGATTRDVLNIAGSRRMARRCERPTLKVMADWFGNLAREASPLSKLGLLVERLSTMTPLEGEFAVRIITGSMRLGLKEGLVEEALAGALRVPLSSVRRAHMLTGDLEETCRLACEGCLDVARLVPGRAVKVMLASPLPTAEAIWHKLIETGGLEHPLVVEDKYDGIRCQAHVTGGVCKLFSRDMKDITGTFPELAEALVAMNIEAVLDGEIVAGGEGGRSGFQTLQRRLGRRGGDFFLGEEVPVELVVFDLLWVDGEQMLDRPLWERRARLSGLPLRAPVQMVRTTPVAGAADIARAFEEARARGSEGLLVKSPSSVYAPGARGFDWIKLKRAGASLDVVVIRAEWGHGKRAGVLSDYTFAVRDDASGRLLPIGKAYSGLTDEEIAGLTQKFLEVAIASDRGGVDVPPEVVLEVAFDSLQQSTRHASGLAMRFPRIVAIRCDKTPEDIDTLATAQKIARKFMNAPTGRQNERASQERI